VRDLCAGKGILVKILYMLAAMKIALGADGFGFVLKTQVAAWLVACGHEVMDGGIFSAAPDMKLMDYADFVAGAVAKGEADRGVLICMSGGMMQIRANRFAGVRAVMGFDADAMVHDREASDANVVCFAASYGAEAVWEDIMLAFLETEFEALDRRLARLALLERVTL